MSRFTIHTAETAPDASQEVLRNVERRFGFVPNLIGTMAAAPTAAKAYATLGDLFGQTSLTPVEQQLVLAAVSVSNGCRYCVAAHSWRLEAAGAGPDTVRAVREGRALADRKLEALRYFTTTVVEQRGWLDESDVEAFLGAGYRQDQILEVLVGVALKTLSNYANHIAAMPLDSALGEYAWESVQAERHGSLACCVGDKHESLEGVMSTAGLASDPNAYFQQLEEHLLDFSLEDQRTALAIYRELAKGEAVDDAQLADALGVSLEEARARRARPAIHAFTYADPEGRILGFGGLAAVPMHHEFVVSGRKLWTWCAWDSLFIPELLGEEARVVSPDPRTKNPVRLTVTPDGVTQVAPQGAVVSFIRPDAGVSTNSAENVMATFCHYVFFFESRESGEAWAADHPDTVLYTVDDAVTLARKLNAWNFGDVLGGA